MNFDCLFRSVDKGDLNSPEIMLRNDEKMRAAIFEIQPWECILFWETSTFTARKVFSYKKSCVLDSFREKVEIRW